MITYDPCCHRSAITDATRDQAANAYTRSNAIGRHTDYRPITLLILGLYEGRRAIALLILGLIEAEGRAPSPI
jgi:hypothetical protein